MKVRITESLDIDLVAEQWVCHGCDGRIHGARENYKKGCLLAEVPMAEAHPPLTEGGFSFSPDPGYCRLIEFYCPHCGITLENEYLPPGHPITHEIELDVSALKRRHGVA